MLRGIPTTFLEEDLKQFDEMEAATYFVDCFVIFLSDFHYQAINKKPTRCNNFYSSKHPEWKTINRCFLSHQVFPPLNISQY